jgi:hypothetical protein
MWPSIISVREIWPAGRPFRSVEIFIGIYAEAVPSIISVPDVWPARQPFRVSKTWQKFSPRFCPPFRFLFAPAMWLVARPFRALEIQRLVYGCTATSIIFSREIVLAGRPHRACNPE